jgi:sulfur-oxidizing protein SoxY
VAIHVQNPADVKSVYLVIENNPAPLAAHITFGPAADAKSVALRVRVDQYTNMHAIAETKEGALYEAHPSSRRREAARPRPAPMTKPRLPKSAK